MVSEVQNYIVANNCTVEDVGHKPEWETVGVLSTGELIGRTNKNF